MFTNFQIEALEAHNKYRELHKVPPLQLSESLCKFSQEWADHLAKTGTMKHRTGSSYGENIYNMWSSDPRHTVNGSDAVDAWYSEIRDHKFGVEPRSMATGHFTQVVWKDSKELGIGVAKNRNGYTFVVGNYSPPGNYVGRYAVSVPPPGGFR